MMDLIRFSLLCRVKLENVHPTWFMQWRFYNQCFIKWNWISFVLVKCVVNISFQMIHWSAVIFFLHDTILWSKFTTFQNKSWVIWKEYLLMLLPWRSSAAVTGQSICVSAIWRNKNNLLIKGSIGHFDPGRTAALSEDIEEEDTLPCCHWLLQSVGRLFCMNIKHIACPNHAKLCTVR